MVSDLSNPRKPGHKTLEQYMGQEMQARYLNPRWADGMLKQGYSGARYINRVVDYLWAWQVTVPEVVDSTKWQRMYDTYVEDRHGLKVRERFAASGNLRAFQAMTDRMLSAIERGYWKPSDAVRNQLTQTNAQAIKDAGVSCSADSCSKATLKIAPQFNPEFAPNVGTNAAIAHGAVAGSRVGGGAPNQQAAQAAARNAVAELQALQAKAQETARDPQPAAAQPPSQAKAKAKPAEPAPQVKADADAKVSGFEMQTLTNLTPVQKTVGTLALLALAAALIGAGYIGRRNKLRKLKEYL
jgi:cobaltochelatase CobN